MGIHYSYVCVLFPIDVFRVFAHTCCLLFGTLFIVSHVMQMQRSYYAYVLEDIIVFEDIIVGKK